MKNMGIMPMKCTGDPDCWCDKCHAARAEAGTKPFTFAKEDLAKGYKAEPMENYESPVRERRQRY